MSEGGAAGHVSMEVMMDRLNHFVHYMHTNDGRMRELENTIVMLESGANQVSVHALSARIGL